MKNRNLINRDDWRTPPNFYKELNERWNFDFDPCPYNHDLTLWDGLKIDWGFRNYVNPPYSRGLKEAFINKAVEEKNKGKLSVMLLPVSTSTKIFHKVVLPNMTDIAFVEGRLDFIGINNKGQFVNYHLLGSVDSSVLKIDGQQYPKYVKAKGQHDSMLVIFDGR